MSRFAFLGALLLGGLAMAAEPPRFGFSHMEYHRLDWDTSNLRVGDINGDGLNDLVIANNARARIDCLLQRRDPPAQPEPELDPNVLPDDPRFESRPFLAEKRIFSIELGDLNGDKRTDMAYYGDPRELVVAYQDDKGQWGARRRFDIADGSTQQAGMAIGDINGDGRRDIVLLATDGVYFIRQDKDGKLEAPVKEGGLPEGAFAVLLRDFNGDKRGDLLYVCASEAAPLCFRFQDAEGRLGPEVRCKAPPIRGLAVGDVTGDGVEQPVAIQLNSGRMVVYDVVEEPSAGALLEGPLERYTFASAGARRPRSLAMGSLSPDGLLDVLVTDPDSAEVELFVQAAGGRWHRRGTFPAFQGASDLALLPAEAQEGVGVLMLSPDESAMGLARMEPNGRLTFPRALPMDGKPTAMTVADLDGDGKPEIACVAVKDRDRFLLVLDAATLAARARIPILDARTDPDGLLAADVNQDGRMDLVLFTPFQEMRVFKATDPWTWVDVSRGADYGKGLVQAAKLKSVALADVTGDGKPELLLASKNFARALRLDERDRLQVVDQFNGRAPTSLIVGVAGADLDSDGTNEVILVDASGRCLTALRRSEIGVYEIAENFPIGPVNMERFLVLDATGDGRPELILLGQNDFSVLRPGRPSTALREVASYETPVRDGRLEGIAVGDLNGDGRNECLVTEGTKNLMELLTWDAPGKRLERSLSWPVFEARSFPGSRAAAGPGSEPREYEIADVTNDGKADVILVIHDRLLVYVGE